MPGNGSKRATGPSLSGSAGWAGHSTSTAWSGSPTTRSRARPRRWPRLRAAGEDVVFCTNNFEPTGGGGRRPSWLATASRPAGDVITSADGRRPRWWSRASACCVCAGPGVVEALDGARGRARVATATPTRWSSGFHRDFDYERLRRAATAVRRGARLIGHQRRPDLSRRRTARSRAAGAILAAVAVASGVAAGGGGQALRARWPTSCGPGSGDDGVGGGRPARHRRRASPGASATGSRSCSAGSTGRRRRRRRPGAGPRGRRTSPPLVRPAVPC